MFAGFPGLETFQRTVQRIPAIGEGLSQTFTSMFQPRQSMDVHFEGAEQPADDVARDEDDSRVGGEAHMELEDGPDDGGSIGRGSCGVEGAQTVTEQNEQCAATKGNNKRRKYQFHDAASIQDKLRQERTIPAELPMGPFASLQDHELALKAWVEHHVDGYSYLKHRDSQKANASRGAWIKLVCTREGTQGNRRARQEAMSAAGQERNRASVRCACPFGFLIEVCLPCWSPEFAVDQSLHARCV